MWRVLYLTYESPKTQRTLPTSLPPNLSARTGLKINISLEFLTFLGSEEFVGPAALLDRSSRSHDVN